MKWIFSWPTKGAIIDKVSLGLCTACLVLARMSRLVPMEVRLMSIRLSWLVPMIWRVSVSMIWLVPISMVGLLPMSIVWMLSMVRVMPMAVGRLVVTNRTTSGYILGQTGHYWLGPYMLTCVGSPGRVCLIVSLMRLNPLWNPVVRSLGGIRCLRSCTASLMHMALSVQSSTLDILEHSELHSARYNTIWDLLRQAGSGGRGQYVQSQPLVETGGVLRARGGLDYFLKQRIWFHNQQCLILNGVFTNNMSVDKNYQSLL